MICIAVSLMISMVSFLTINRYGCYLSVMRTMQFFPFFVLGHYMTSKAMNKIRGGNWKWVFTILSIIVVTTICCFAGPQLNAVLFSKYGIMELADILGTGLEQTFIIRYTVMMASVILCFFVLSAFECPKWFSANGKTTLCILCTHVIIYHFASQITSLMPALYVAISTIFVLTIVARTSMGRWLLYPYSSVMNSLRNNYK